VVPVSQVFPPKSFIRLYFSHTRYMPGPFHSSRFYHPNNIGWGIQIINPLNAELNPICHLLILLGDLRSMGPCIVSIFQYISNKMQLTQFISENCSICFEWYFHPSSGAHTTVSTASGICHNVTAICRYRGRVGTGLNVLWVASPPTAHSKQYALLMMGGSTTRNM
jgi:hypothetical protein